MNQNKSAFTLIELLVVIVIIGILATIGIAQFNTYQEKARRAALAAQIMQEKKAYLADCASQGVDICPVDFNNRTDNPPTDLSNPTYNYVSTAAQCEQLCEDNGERLATAEEGLWFAKNNSVACAYMWFYYDNSATKFIRTYPMYGPGSSGCGGVVTGDAMAARLVYGGLQYDMNEFYNAAPPANAQTLDQAIGTYNCACVSYDNF